MQTNPQIGQLIQAARKAQHISQMELQDMSGVSASVIYKAERGRTDLTLGSFMALCDSLGIQINCRSPLGTEVRLHG
ncbi:MAG: Helix-turn-helix domain [Verrucomicrobiota bacterium]|jgi:transcriptional regulator with XRE-family HTH domain